MIVTLFTDASWCPQTKVMGWGAWAKSDLKPAGVEFKGSLRGITSSGDAEIVGLLAALQSIARAGMTEPGSSITVWMDSVHTIKILQRERPTRTPIERQALQGIEALIKSREIGYHAEYVSGHAPDHWKKERYRINRIVDQLAKQEMLKAREAAKARK